MTLSIPHSVFSGVRDAAAQAAACITPGFFRQRACAEALSFCRAAVFTPVSACHLLTRLYPFSFLTGQAYIVDIGPPPRTGKTVVPSGSDMHSNWSASPAGPHPVVVCRPNTGAGQDVRWRLWWNSVRCRRPVPACPRGHRIKDNTKVFFPRQVVLRLTRRGLQGAGERHSEKR